MGPATLPLGRGLLRPSLFSGAVRGGAAADKPETHLPPRVSPERKPGGGGDSSVVPRYALPTDGLGAGQSQSPRVSGPSGRADGAVTAGGRQTPTTAPTTAPATAPTTAPTVAPAKATDTQKPE